MRRVTGADHMIAAEQRATGERVGSILGNRVQRVEDPRFLTRGGDYIDAMRFPGEAWVVYVRSPYAHAEIGVIDADEARRLPGVLGVYTISDLAS